VRHGGYYALEYSFSEYYPFTLGFKIGVEKFYTNILVGFSPFQDTFKRKFVSGLGFGSILPITPVFFFNPELITWNQILSSNSENTELTATTSFVPYFGCNINKHFSIAAGPSVTWAYHHDRENVLKPFFSLLNHDINEKHSIILGARAAVRFRF
jgi:hypothetical protein